MRRVGERLGTATRLVVGQSYAELAADRHDVAVVCGLPYVELVTAGAALVAVASVVYKGDRYGGQPIYFSDVVVHTDAPAKGFADLAGCRWAFNEPPSQSGVGVVRHRLARAGLDWWFLGQLVPAGYHADALRMVSSGAADAAAIDSHVLETVDPQRELPIRTIETLGPSTTAAVVVSHRLEAGLHADIAVAFCGIGVIPGSGIAGFRPAVDGSYDDIRALARESAAAGVPALGAHLALLADHPQGGRRRRRRGCTPKNTPGPAAVRRAG